MPLLASIITLYRSKWIGYRMPIAISALLAIIGLIGFILCDGWVSWFFALITGCASTIELILIVSLPAVISKGSSVTRLNAGMTLIGFTIAFLCSLLGGYLADRFNWIELALLPSIIFAFIALLALGRTARFSDYH